MEILTEEVFSDGEAPYNRIHAAVGVYQNTGQAQIKVKCSQKTRLREF